MPAVATALQTQQVLVTFNGGSLIYLTRHMSSPHLQLACRRNSRCPRLPCGRWFRGGRLRYFRQRIENLTTFRRGVHSSSEVVNKQPNDCQRTFVCSQTRFAAAPADYGCYQQYLSTSSEISRITPPSAAPQQQRLLLEHPALQQHHK